MEEVRLLVCGGRDYNDFPRVDEEMRRFIASHGEPSVVIHGAARGADRMAGAWAQASGIAQRAFPADWDRHPRRAGPIRNRQMLREGRPTHVLAFPGGSGTADMVRIAERAGVTVVTVRP